MKKSLYSQFMKIHREELIQKAIRDFGKTPRQAAEAFDKLYELDRKTFDEIVYKIKISGGNLGRIALNTGLDLETLLRLMRVLVKSGIVKIDRNGRVRTQESNSKGEKKLSNIKILSKINLDLNQHPCLPKSSIRTTKKIMSDTPQNSRIIFLGDDNLMSVFMASASDMEVHALDYDGKTLVLIRRIAKENGLSIHTHKVDLIKGLPNTLKNRFDAFVSGPSWNAKSVKLFAYRGWEALKKERGCKGYLFFSPFVVSNRLLEVQRFINSMGFQFEEIATAFNKYPIMWDYSESDSIRRFANDMNVDIKKLSKYPFIFSTLYKLKLFNTKTGSKVNPNVKKIYDYYAI